MAHLRRFPSLVALPVLAALAGCDAGTEPATGTGPAGLLAKWADK